MKKESEREREIKREEGGKCGGGDKEGTNNKNLNLDCFVWDLLGVISWPVPTSKSIFVRKQNIDYIFEFNERHSDKSLSDLWFTALSPHCNRVQISTQADIGMGQKVEPACCLPIAINVHVFASHSFKLGLRRLLDGLTKLFSVKQSVIWKAETPSLAQASTWNKAERQRRKKNRILF